MNWAVFPTLLFSSRDFIELVLFLLKKYLLEFANETIFILSGPERAKFKNRE
jgi:hypothetical protein